MKRRSPVRVAILNYRDDARAGGSLRVSEVIAKHLDPDRIEAHLVFAYGGAGPISQKASVPCHFLQAKGPKDIRAWARARREFQRIKPDIIHFVDNIVWLQAALLGTGYSRVIHIHGRFQHSEMGAVNRFIWRVSNNLAAHLVFISPGALNNLIQLGLSKGEKSSVVYNSVDCYEFAELMEKNAARRYLGLPENVLLLGMLGRLVPNKGGSDFLSLLHRLPAGWHGLICGDGPQRAELEAHSRRLDLNGRIHFIGTQDDVAPVYAALDAYAFLSRYESFGLTIAEAMASRVPVFGFGGYGEYRESPHCLVTPETAALVECYRDYASDTPANEESLDQLSRLLIDYANQPGRYREMIERAAAWVRICFDAPLQTEAMAQIYEYICESEGAVIPELDDLYEAARSRASAGIETYELPAAGARAEVA